MIYFVAWSSWVEHEKTLKYYSNNKVNKLTVLKVIKKYDVKNFVFSSSVTVYGG